MVNGGAHGMLVDAEVEVAAGKVPPAGGGGHEVAELGILGLGGGGEVGGPNEEVGAADWRWKCR